MCSYILSNARGDTCWNKGETTTIRLSLCCPLVFVKEKTIFNSCYAGQGFYSFYFVFFLCFFFFLTNSNSCQTGLVRGCVSAFIWCGMPLICNQTG